MRPIQQIQDQSLLRQFGIDRLLLSEGETYLMPSQDGFYRKSHYCKGPMIARTMPSYRLTMRLGIVAGRHMLCIPEQESIALPGGYSFSRNWAVTLSEHGERKSTLQSVAEREYIRGRAAILGITSHYGHMFVDCIDRNYHLEHNEFDHFVVDRLSEFGEFYLCGKLGIPRDKIYELGARSVQFDELVWNTNYSCKPFWSPTTLHCLKDWCGNIEGAVDGPSIFVTRRMATKRRILNLAEVEPVFSRFGFDCIDTAEISIAEQIELFSAAGVVIGPIGTDLFNVAFCRPGTTIICLVQRFYFDSMGDNVAMLRSLASLIRLRLFFILCDSEENSYDSDFTVDIRSLVGAMKLLTA